MPDMISIEEAHSVILDAIRITVIENVDIMDSLGRVLAEDLSSDIDIAPFDNTGMDGFALMNEDISAASQDAPVSLEIISHIGAGFVFEGTLHPGQAVRIMTGAPIPIGADAVEKIEDVTWTGEGSVGDKVTFIKPIEVGRNIRKAGEDVKAGEVVIHAGETISPAGIGLLASTGHGS
ncbi:MAG: molybdopterin molybdenumtransferase MoeA, partial [Actinobacteria bacterium]|nr:molybdopterin molybdenumtransferase MoeA [Actinomycetota bacterium]